MNSSPILDYLNNKKTVSLFDGVKFKRVEQNKDGSFRWRCCSCNSVSFTTLDEKIIRLPTKIHLPACERKLPVQIECEREYEKLKNQAKIEDHFNFSDQYKQYLQSLQAKYDNREIAEFWPSEERAKNTCYCIRYNKKQVDPISSSYLVVNEIQKTINVNNERQSFLRYDNNNQNGNRILIFFSDVGAEILEKTEEYHIDGTFKYAPKIFYQLLTIHCVVKNIVLACAFIFLEKKQADSYIEALEQIRNLTFNKNLKLILTDFEYSLMVSINTVFKEVQIKGCWFHFCQAVKRRLFSFGYKTEYLNNWDFRFWIRRFLVLPLIPIEYLERALEIIISEIPFKNENLISFVKYFIKQWVNGEISPLIWNHHKTDKRRTNNDLEGFHSGLKKSGLKVHPKVSDMIEHIKSIDSRTRDIYLKSVKLSIDKLPKQKEYIKNLQIEVIHQEFYQNGTSFAEYFKKLAHQMMNPYESFLDETEVVEINELIETEIIENKNKRFKKDKLVNNFRNENLIDLLIKLEDNQMEKKTSENKIFQNGRLKRGRPLGSNNKVEKEDILPKFDQPEVKKQKNNADEYSQISSIVKVEEVTLSDSNLEIENLDNGLFLSEKKWLSSSHIDYGLDFLDGYFNKPFKFKTITYWRTWQIQKLLKETIQVCINPSNDQIFVLNANNNHWLILTNIDPTDESEKYLDEFDDQNMLFIGRKWFIYDSLNDANNVKSTKSIFKFLYPEQEVHTVNMVQVKSQFGTNDCGLFALAYAYDFSLGRDPSNFFYDQQFMRSNYNTFLKTSFLLEFKSEFLSEQKRIIKTVTF
ncbi:unnamed protein product [Brachionus calyciflorus]|uniref:Ubiquitin-like protease family profile domain-containing protein n=1 Tax=Brachionus calyciflorus TaxID=104777 RepID=A0A814D268_9BILA|nr:unnamed protein product [Brachionus calyciflorus]